MQASRERLSFDKQTTFAFNYFVLKHFVKIAYEAEKQLKQCKVFEDYLDVTTKWKFPIWDSDEKYLQLCLDEQWI